jgi:hypothetical protein
MYIKFTRRAKGSDCNDGIAAHDRLELAQRRLDIVHGFRYRRFGSNFNQRLKLIYCNPTLSSEGEN